MENMKLFHEKMNARIDAERTPGPERGRITRAKALGIEHPSTRAASSSSRGMASKKGIMTHTMNGSPTSMWVRMSAMKVSTRCSWRKRMNQGMRNVMPGTMRATRIAVDRVRWRKRAME